jgi:phage gp36-like protein
MPTPYCTREDIERLAIRAEALEELDEADVNAVILAASVEADGYLNAAYTLPLTAWGDDLRAHVASLVVYRLLNARGRDPEGDPLVDQVHADAISWLKGVASGRILPPDIVDSTPDEYDGGGVVVSQARRGW